LSASSRERLLAVLRVQPGEQERVALMLLLSLLSVGGVVITGQIVARSLFLSALPASAIPLRFIVPPLLLVAATAEYSRRLGRAEPAGVRARTCVAAAAAVLACRLLLATPLHGERSFLLLLFSVLEIAGSLAMIQFWTLAGSVFDAREARRLFGLISSGSAISNVAFGLFLGKLAAHVPPENLLWPVVLSLLAAGAIAERLERRHVHRHAPAAAQRPASGAPSTPPAAGGPLHGLRTALSSPLVAMLAALAVLTAAIGNVTDYQLDLALKSGFGGDGGAMIGFLARLRLVAGLVGVVVQLFAAGWLMERFGVLAALLLLPAAVGLGSLSILASGGALWAVAVPRAADVAFKYSVNDSAFNLLYLPLSSDLRGRAKALIDGVLKPPTVALLGLVFLAVDRFARLPYVYWSVPALLLAAAWLVGVVRTERRYVRALAESIALRRIDPGRERVVFSDETSRRVLLGSLHDPSPERIVHALTLVRATAGVDCSAELAPLLAHPSPEVRAAALEQLAEAPSAPLAGAVRLRLADAAPQVRVAAARALARTLGAQAVGELAALLSDPSREVRSAALVALVRDGGLGGFLHAGGALHSMLGSEDAAERRDGARVLGELGVSTFYHPLLELMADPDRSVRLAAIRAAERVASPELVPALLESLEDPRLRRPAIASLVACGGGELSVLGSLLAQPGRPPDLRCQLAGALGRLGRRAVAALAAALDDADDAVRGAALAALGAVQRSEGELGIERGRLLARLDAEVRLSFERWLRLRDLRAATGERLPLLCEALERAATHDRERVLRLLELLRPGLDGPALGRALAGADPRRRAEALELIDSAGVAARAAVLAYLGGSESQRLEVAERRLGLARVSSLGGRLAELAAGGDRWTRACALDAIGRVGSHSLRGTLDAAAGEPDGLLALTARDALRRLDARGRPGPLRMATEAVEMPMVPLEQVLFLKQVPLFRDIPGEEIAGLLPIVEQIEFAAGETLIRQGDHGDSLYIIVEGTLAIDVNGRGQGTKGPRDVIGELAILSGEPRAATCSAVSAGVALRIRREPFWELMRERPEVSLGVIRILIGYLRARNAEALPQAPAGEVA
jgi:HEAT repeat protein